jgi:cytochrome c oxidase assembly protein subunit 15
MLHRFSKFLVACTVLLILAGSLVTSHDAGLSVPDWPTSYGWNMFTFPPSMWVANILYEHGHRLIASTVGFLTIVMAVWLWIAEPRRRWLRWFGVATLGSVVAQGLLGGLTVLFFLPAAISTAHAGLAEIFFCMTVAIAIFTSPGWIAGYSVGADPRLGAADQSGHIGPRLRNLATFATFLIYAQILVGATMRHTGAGLAIPDFPLMFGHLVPDHWSPAIAIHFTHRVGALLVTLTILTLFAHVWSRYRHRRELMRPASLIVALVAVQVTLGALTVLSRRDPLVNSLHVVCGAMVLTTALVLTLRTWRERFAMADVRLRPDTTNESAGATSGGNIRLQPDRGNVRLQPDQGNVRLQPDQGSVRLQPDPRGRA